MNKIEYPIWDKTEYTIDEAVEILKPQLFKYIFFKFLQEVSIAGLTVKEFPWLKIAKEDLEKGFIHAIDTDRKAINEGTFMISNKMMDLIMHQLNAQSKLEVHSIGIEIVNSSKGEKN